MNCWELNGFPTLFLLLIKMKIRTGLEASEDPEDPDYSSPLTLLLFSH